MNNHETLKLIAELRERAEHPATGSNVAQCMREAADRLAALTKELDRAHSDAGWAANMDRQGGA